MEKTVSLSTVGWKGSWSKAAVGANGTSTLAFKPALKFTLRMHTNSAADRLLPRLTAAETFKKLVVVMFRVFGTKLSAAPDCEITP